MSARKAGAEDPPVPEFSSDRMKLLAPMVTPRILNMARQRVFTGEHFFYKDKLSVEVTWEELKIVLILVLEINPHEDLDNNEQGALRGMTRALYAKQSEKGELKR